MEQIDPQFSYIEVAFNLPVETFFTYLRPDEAPALLGYRVEVAFGRRKMTGFVVASTQERPEGNFKISPVLKVLDKEPFFGEEEIELAQWVSESFFCSVGEALAVMLPGGIRESKKELINNQEVADYRPRTLSDQQQAALSQILSGQGDYFYLYGITGAGKTEVFLQAAKGVIEKGQSVIYLVPEIALTHQLIRDVYRRFEGKVALLHSHLTAGERLVEWNRIRSGEAKLVIGARSAIFAPAKHLGLIIIDEEHESSYKSGNSPRYHARQVAMYRVSKSMKKLSLPSKKEAHLEGSSVNLVMGSATPSVEVWHLMKTGRFKRIDLTKRLSGGALPHIEVLDITHESTIISTPLQQKIVSVFEEKKQTILFLNRKGFNYFFHCKSCGYEMRCKNCSVALTYYKHQNKMKCHYCGHSQKPIAVCPQCGSLDVGYSGFGTELVEEEVSRLFPQMKVARIDGETVQKRGVLASLLKQFREGEIDLLLGTQMVAKGLNFPGVKLVGIILADTALHLPDFRASERTFSLITQVAGRAGRFSPDGEVLIQTYSPKSNAIDLACKGELELFYDEELTIRKQLGFPPFKRLARLVFRGSQQAAVEQFAKEITHMLQQHAVILSFDLLGPAECPIAVVNKKYRMHIILRSDTFKPLHQAIWLLKPLIQKNKKVYVEIDMDPVALL